MLTCVLHYMMDIAFFLVFLATIKEFKKNVTFFASCEERESKLAWFDNVIGQNMQFVLS